MVEKKTTRKAARPAARKAAKPARKKTAAKPAARADEDASRLITQRIRDLGDWRGDVLAELRSLILAADPEVVEEVKWRKPTNPAGVPVWSRGGILCTGETYQDKVKLTFANGAKLNDPARLFNASLDAGTRRAIDVHKGERVDARAFQALIRDAVALNMSKPKSGR